MTLAAVERTDARSSQPHAAAEAARYALLRRLAPSIRHHLVVNLQPIGMIYEVMDRRLRSQQPDLAGVQESAAKINGFARAALNSCLDVVSWLAPDEGTPCSITEGVRECTSLLATGLSFRGYALRNEVGDVPGQVQRCAMRNLLTGLLLHATDEHEPPADLVLKAEAQSRGVRISIEMRPTQGGQGFANETNYRGLDWADMQALATAENVELDRDAPTRFSLLIPWLTAA